MVFLLTVGFFLSGVFADQALDLSPVEKWLEKMDGLKSVETSFVQQKFLRTLRKPLTTSGHIWLQYPDDFRWEIGDPPSTVAIRNQDILTILEPKKMRAKQFSLAPEEGKGDSKVPASIRSMSKTFPRSMEELEAHFDILNIEMNENVYELALKPKDKKLTVAMLRVVFFIDVKKYHLHGFEIQFRDKSRIRTTFTGLQLNPTIPKDLLKPNLIGYKLSNTIR